MVDIAFRYRKPRVGRESAPAMLGEVWIERFDVGSGVAIPIGTAGAPKGVLTLDDPRPRRFTERVVSLAETPATHFGLLYARARLLDAHARRLRSGVAVPKLPRDGRPAATPLAGGEIAAPGSLPGRAGDNHMDCYVVEMATQTQA